MSTQTDDQSSAAKHLEKPYVEDNFKHGPHREIDVDDLKTWTRSGVLSWDQAGGEEWICG